MGKKIDIDSKKVRMLASFGCTYMDIGRYYQCSESVIRKRFKAEFESGQEELKLSLRKNLLKLALEQENTAASIFLAKNFLGMSDKTAVDLTGNIESVLKECGFEDNPIDKENTEPREALEALGVSPNTTPTGRT
jgi:AraC-like DNA-binding protein